MTARVLVLGVFTVACSKPTPPPPPPMQVQVAAAETRTVPVVVEYTGEVRGAEDVQVMARVPGFLQQQAYREGEVVRKGDLLFVIDPRQLESDVARAKAEVAQQEAILTRATVQVNRLRPLAEKNAVSKQDLDNAEANEAAAKASLDAARAVLERTQLDLSYTRVTSPITGVAGLRQIDLGTYVGAPQPSVLTIVSRLDPVRFDFGVAEAAYLDYVRDTPPGVRRANREKPIAELVLADGTVHPYKGKITVLGRGVDPNTGTLPIQAVFPNPQGVLRPGQFARIRIPIRLQKDAVVIPQRAVQEIQGTYNVAVVHPDSTVEIRPVEVSHQVGSEYVVSKGLTPGERIVVEGLQKVRQGAKVRPALASSGAPTDSTRAN
jgi:membrane fusion protein, multidrug efflux system